ncbi:Pharynx and intestine in excess protein 1 [Datura stramonium]|uniref:Pharynx and intestine in excess protein 1 n=1 Tax=Datura stramonium TaxID=4076 RepID=A0ABS8VG62_DATST|nr:Pharynx and intestine in excess protein 1 [Datura stramonium]
MALSGTSKGEAPKEPQRPKTHWDHVLEEIILVVEGIAFFINYIATYFSSIIFHQEEEHAYVLYKHQLELDEKKKKSLDKQLEFLLGQTERTSFAGSDIDEDTGVRSEDEMFCLLCDFTLVRAFVRLRAAWEFDYLFLDKIDCNQLISVKSLLLAEVACLKSGANITDESGKGIDKCGSSQPFCVLLIVSQRTLHEFNVHVVQVETLVLLLRLTKAAHLRFLVGRFCKLYVFMVSGLTTTTSDRQPAEEKSHHFAVHLCCVLYFQDEFEREEELAKAEANDAADETKAQSSDLLMRNFDRVNSYFQVALLQKELPFDELLARYNEGDDSESYASASDDLLESPAHNESEPSRVNDGPCDVLPTTVAEKEEKEVESVDKTEEERQGEI